MRKIIVVALVSLVLVVSGLTASTTVLAAHSTYIGRYVVDGHAHSPYIKVPANYEVRYRCYNAEQNSTPSYTFRSVRTEQIVMQGRLICDGKQHSTIYHMNKPDVIVIWANVQVDFQVWGRS